MSGTIVVRGIRCEYAGVVFHLKIISFALSVLLIASTASTASAQAESDEPYFYTEYEQSWYGWQTLALDVPLTGLFFFTLREGKRVPAYTSLTLFALGAPAVHALHDRWKPAAISVLTRATFSLVGAVGVQGIAKAIDGDASEDKQRAAAVAIVNLLPMAFDAIVLSHEEKERRVDLSRPRMIPQLDLSSGMPWVGISGTF